MWPSFTTPVGSLKNSKSTSVFAPFSRYYGLFGLYEVVYCHLLAKSLKDTATHKILLTSKSLIMSPVTMGELVCAPSKNSTSPYALETVL